MIDNNQSITVKNVLFLSKAFNQLPQVKLTLGGNKTMNIGEKGKKVLRDDKMKIKRKNFLLKLMKEEQVR